MKVVQINSVCGSGSTGKICVAVSRLLTERNMENYLLYALGTSDYPLGIRHGDPRGLKWQILKAKTLGNYGFQSRNATMALIRELERIAPDVVHLHNLHSHNVHLGMLFGYLKEKKIKLFWTFHDCWAFTGYCMYYDMAHCDRWKTGCQNCPQRKHYSWIFDRSSDLYRKKKELFSGLDLTIITPSQWLADQVRQSFLGDYPVKVIHNGIDLSLFRPRQSDFRRKYNLAGKFVILGVALGWEPRKGLDVFLELAKQLDDRFRIVLVGTNDKIDRQLPENVISIHRTQNQQELAEIYSAADVFLNATREDNFPTVNLEALACGTPVITFRTGGSPEAIDETCGCVVDCDNLTALGDRLRLLCVHNPYSEEACLARAANFEQNRSFRQYARLYEAE